MTKMVPETCFALEMPQVPSRAIAPVETALRADVSGSGCGHYTDFSLFNESNTNVFDRPSSVSAPCRRISDPMTKG